jgi:hypothetical protein
VHAAPNAAVHAIVAIQFALAIITTTFRPHRVRRAMDEQRACPFAPRFHARKGREMRLDSC